MSEHDTLKEGEDPCGEFGPTQRWATIWFISVIFIGALLTATFSKIDRQMYDTNAQVLDFEKYRENRMAFTSIPTEEGDPRVFGDFGSAANK